MNETITLCGDNCIECPRYNAHSDEELKKVAELWYRVGYDSEQEELTAKIKELEKSAIADKEQLSSIEHFAEQISGYAGITELNFKIINQLIEKILVSEPVEIDGQKIQRLTIHYKFIGALGTLE